MVDQSRSLNVLLIYLINVTVAVIHRSRRRCSGEREKTERSTRVAGQTVVPPARRLVRRFTFLNTSQQNDTEP